MKLTINLPSVAGGGTREVDVAEWPQHIKDALLGHGLQQKIADAVANATKEEWTKAQCGEKIDAAIAALAAGTWARRGGPRITNEDDFVIARLVATLKAAAKAKKIELTDEDAKARAAKALESDNPQLVAMIGAIRAEWQAKQAAKSISDLI